MNYIIAIFWSLMFCIIYSYVLYPLLLQVLVWLKPKKTNTAIDLSNLPSVTLFITAYNEQAYVDQKVENSNNLIYPKDKIEQLWVTDGSNDNTNKLLKKYPEVRVLFEAQRKGKINAMNRGMDYIDSDIVVFSDGNTLLGQETIMEIAKLFQNQKVGCIAGEKRIETKNKDAAASAGEGFYWKYESWLKNLDAKFGSTIGAAGELFAIRTSLFQKVESGTILDDFIISLRIAMQGYKVDYSQKAFAIEKASANVGEEMKRKVRIAAGSIQTLVRLAALLNLFKYKKLSFQYISHKVLRWVVVPLSLLGIIILNAYIIYANQFDFQNIYGVIGLLQLLFYIVVFIGHVLKNRSIQIRLLFVPYYFFMANLAMYLGFIKNIRGKQSVNWERAKRAE